MIKKIIKSGEELEEALNHICDTSLFSLHFYADCLDLYVDDTIISIPTMPESKYDPEIHEFYRHLAHFSYHCQKDVWKSDQPLKS